MCYTLKPKVPKFQLPTPSPFLIGLKLLKLTEIYLDSRKIREGSSVRKIVFDYHNWNLLVNVKMFKRDNMSEVCTEAQVYEDVKRVKLYPNLPFHLGVSANMKPLYLVT